MVKRWVEGAEFAVVSGAMWHVGSATNFFCSNDLHTHLPGSCGKDFSSSTLAELQKQTKNLSLRTDYQAKIRLILEIDFVCIMSRGKTA